MHFPAVFFGTLREHYFVLFGAAGSFALLAGLVGAWLGGHIAGRRSARQVAKQLANEVTDAGQFREVMQAIDVLSVEVERLSEGNRYIAKLLADRLERDRLAALPLMERKSEHVTPH
jgi:hypothetical protein